MRPGFLLLNKPRGLRSTECVEKIKRALRGRAKVGHGGTLDSTASGVLVLLVGGATRASDLVMSMPKRYFATAQLGVSTTTDDSSGDEISRLDASKVKPEIIDIELAALLGTRMQVPPQISAVHVEGVRAHKIARGGSNAALSPRPVFVERIERVSGVTDDGKVDLIVNCSKGTYVRSLVRDLGDRLGCGAHVAFLERESVGPFTLEGAAAASQLFDLAPDELEGYLIPIESLCGYFSGFEISADEEAAVGHGRPIRTMKEASVPGKFAREEAIVLRGSKLFSICKANIEGGEMILYPRTNIYLDCGEAK